MSRRIITIDCDYLHKKFAASYLVIDQGQAAFIDNNTTHAVPKLMAALSAAGLKPKDVRYVIITHVHLDHAGGTSLLMQQCPDARLLAHPRAATHMIDPTKLVSSARKVYGEQEFARLYGELQPIDAARVDVMADDAVVDFGDTAGSLRFMHTRGHANHHFCIVDDVSKAVFTGDAFGLCYPALNQGSLFVFPSTSPTDFLATEAQASVQRILRCGARSAFLTHYGEVTNMSGAAGQLARLIDLSEELRLKVAASALSLDEASHYCEGELRLIFARVIQDLGVKLDAAQWQLMELDLKLNAQGLAWTGLKARSKAALNT